MGCNHPTVITRGGGGIAPEMREDPVILGFRCNDRPGAVADLDSREKRTPERPNSRIGR